MMGLNIKTICFFLLISISFFLHATSARHYGTNTPYPAPEENSYLEAPPRGYNPVFTGLVARHGARALLNSDNMDSLLVELQRAEEKKCLTALGTNLIGEIRDLKRANQALGYGNLSRLGIEEQERLARRLFQRMRPIFSKDRTILYQSSGVPRANASAEAFISSLKTQDPELTIQKTAAQKPTVKEPVKPEPAGVNRFLLYFHKLNKQDLISKQDKRNIYVRTVRESLIYQHYQNDPHNPKFKMLKSIYSKPIYSKTAKKLLKKIFLESYLQNINLKQQQQLAENLYKLYAICPALKYEYGKDLSDYLSDSKAAVFEYLFDAKEFYSKGPSSDNSAHQNNKIARMLLYDFFSDIDKIQQADLSIAAKLRFSHAEIIIPFSNLLGISDFSQSMPAGKAFSYKNNPWRGAKVAPFSANIQWDVYRNADNKILVRMLYNEQAMDFKPSCENARYEKTHFYDYDGLAACYGYQKRNQTHALD